MSNNTCKKTHLGLVIISIILVVAAVIGSLIWIAYETEEIDTMAEELNLEKHIYEGAVANAVLSVAVMFVGMLFICLLAVWFVPMLSRMEKGVKLFLGFITVALVVGLLFWMIWETVAISASSKTALRVSLPVLGNNSFLINQAVSDNSYLRINSVLAHILTVLACAGGAMVLMLVLYGIIDGFRRFICVLEEIAHNTNPSNKLGEKSAADNKKLNQESTR